MTYQLILRFFARLFLHCNISRVGTPSPGPAQTPLQLTAPGVGNANVEQAHRLKNAACLLGEAACRLGEASR